MSTTTEVNLNDSGYALLFAVGVYFNPPAACLALLAFVIFAIILGMATAKEKDEIVLVVPSQAEIDVMNRKIDAECDVLKSTKAEENLNE